MSIHKPQTISLSPPKKQNQFFPAIYLKTTETPQKGNPNYANYLGIGKISNNRSVKTQLDLQLDKAYSIRNYLQTSIFLKSDTSKLDSKIMINNSMNDLRENITEKASITSSLKQLNKLEETLNIIKIVEKQKQQDDNNQKQNQIIGTQQCIQEEEQEQEQDEIKMFQNQVMLSPILQIDRLNEEIRTKSYSPSKNIVLKINQQNKEYKKYASQMIRMIRNSHSTIMNELDDNRLQKLKQYQQQKQQRQRERSEALTNAKEGIKNRQLKTMLQALKGSPTKQIGESPLFLNLSKKFSFQQQQQQQQQSFSKRTSNSKIFIYPSQPDKLFDDKNIRKASFKSEICSLETSLELPIQISKFI